MFIRLGNMNNKKIKLMALALGIVVIILLVLWLVLGQDNKANLNPQTGGSLNYTEFMTTQEKADFELSSDSQVQVISRDDQGKVSVYKIIRSEEDIVSDPSQLPPISPNFK